MGREMFHVTFSFCEPGKEACPEIWEPVQQKRRGRFKTLRSDLQPKLDVPGLRFQNQTSEGVKLNLR